MAEHKPVDWRTILTFEPGKRGGQPCIRRMRFTVGDVLDYLAGGMTVPQLLEGFPYLTEQDVFACLAFVAERERIGITGVRATPPEPVVPAA